MFRNLLKKLTGNHSEEVPAETVSDELPAETVSDGPPIENDFDESPSKSIFDESHIGGFSWRCNVCDQSNDLIAEEVRKLDHVRERLNCAGCTSSSRKRHVVKAILGLHARECMSLAEAIPALSELTIYSTVSYDIFHMYLGKDNPNFVCSDLFSDLAAGETRDGIYCQNLEYLTFDDEQFDIIITEDVMEHVRHPEKAFREISRVLKPNGWHIFTVPYFMGNKTTSRVETRTDVDEFIVPPEYHYDSSGKNVLVYNDWGYDIFEIVDAFGFTTNISRSLCRDTVINGIADSIVFYSQKTRNL